MATALDIDKLEKQAAQGDAAKVSKDLQKLAPLKLTDAQVLRCANLARITGATQWGLKALTPRVRDPQGKLTANQELLALYCGLLVKAGAPQEALKLLSTIKAPPASALLYRVHALVSQWQYAETIPLLYEYLERVTREPRQQVIGELNLFAALIHEGRSKEAHGIAEQLLTHARALQDAVLLTSVLEVRAQLALLDKRWSEALDWLNQSDAVAPGTERHRLFVNKWKALALVAQEPKSKKAHAELNAVGEFAIRLHHWETVRDCDRIAAVYCKDKELAIKLYFGTSYEAYRRYLMRELAEPVDIPAHYPLALGSGATKPKQLSLLLEKESLWFQLSPNSARLLALLLSDFYRGQSIPELFFRMHPDESFNVFSSPPRIRVAVNELKKAVKKLGLDIVSENGMYSVTSKKPVTILIPKNLEKLATSDFRQAFLKAQGVDPDDAEKVSAVLGVSSRTARRVQKKRGPA